MHTASQKLRLSMISCAAAALVSSSVAAQATSPIVNQVAGEADSWQHFTVEIPEGASALNVVLSSGTGDADLYVRFGEQPTTRAWDCRPYKEAADESCAITPRAGTYHISINGYTAFSGSTLTTTWTTPDPNAPPVTLDAWKQKVLDRHNTLRADHCAAPLAWDEEVAASAQAWADQCTGKHAADPGGLGENLAADSDTNALNTLETRVDSWYSEVELYDFANPGFSMDTGHFTQVVWRGTSKLGCGVKQCPSSSTVFPWAEGRRVTFLVCRYAAGGNITGEFPANALPKPADGVCAQ